jgi:acetyl esterase/lipase
MKFLPRPVDLINASVRITGLRVTRNLAFGPLPRHRMDIYAPADAHATSPVLIFFYGGSWQMGERADYRFVAATLARAGIIVAVPDYRLHPETAFPGFIEDGALATAWMARHAGRFGADGQNIFLAGHSAGAYIALMLGLDPQWLRAAGYERKNLAGLIGISGPYDFLPIKAADIKAVFAPAADLAQTQPINFANDEAPPALLVTGGADTTVLPRNSTAVAARLRAAGSVVETRIYPGVGHIGIILSCLPWLAWRAPLLADIEQFIAAATQGEFAGCYSAAERDMAG